MAQSTTDRWELAVEKLADMTRRGELTWKPTRSITPPDAADANLIGPAFVTCVNNKHIAVYEYRYKYFTGEDEWHWEPETAIQFVDSNTFATEWLWPSPRGREQLLDAIRYEHVGAGAFLDGLLSKTVAD